MTGKEFIRTLDNEIDMWFAFLIHDLGGTHSRGLSRLDAWPGPASLKALKDEDLPGLFVYINRFEFPSLILDISYGDRELILESICHYPEPACQRFYPTEILRAVGVEDIEAARGISGQTFVHTPDVLTTTIQVMARRIREYWSVISKPSPETIDRALHLRGQRLIFDQAEQRRRDREAACAKASMFFHSGRYKEAFDVLMPFAEDKELTAGSRQLLVLARKRRNGEQK